MAELKRIKGDEDKAAASRDARASSSRKSKSAARRPVHTLASFHSTPCARATRGQTPQASPPLPGACTTPRRRLRPLCHAHVPRMACTPLALSPYPTLCHAWPHTAHSAPLALPLCHTWPQATRPPRLAYVPRVAASLAPLLPPTRGFNTQASPLGRSPEALRTARQARRPVLACFHSTPRSRATRGRTPHAPPLPGAYATHGFTPLAPPLCHAHVPHVACTPLALPPY